MVINVIIAGAGGIAEAAALLLAEWSPEPVAIFIGNRTLAKAQQVAAWIEAGVSRPCNITPFHLPEQGLKKVRSLDYKTLRHPGHYAWVQNQLAYARQAADPIAALQQRMEKAIPHMEDDRVVLYAAVEGRDADGTLRRRETAKLIRPLMLGKHRLRAIQTTTAVPLLESAMMLLEGKHWGVVLQSTLDPKRFLEGYFVKKVYG